MPRRNELGRIVARRPWPCAGCGRMTAHKRQAKALGVVAAGSATHCGTCHVRKHPRPTLKGARVGVRRGGRDVDWVVVERLVHGTFTGVPTTGELDTAIRQLTDRGLSAREIATRLRVTTRTVVRHRAAHRGAHREEAA